MHWASSTNEKAVSSCYRMSLLLKTFSRRFLKYFIPPRKTVINYLRWSERPRPIFSNCQNASEVYLTCKRTYKNFNWLNIAVHSLLQMSWQARSRYCSICSLDVSVIVLSSSIRKTSKNEVYIKSVERNEYTLVTHWEWKGLHTR